VIVPFIILLIYPVRCDKINPVYKRKDFYYQKAKEEGYFSRAAFKLLEIVNSYEIIKKNDKIIDIGCSPGGWSQVALKITAENGLVIGVDITEPDKLWQKNFIFIKGEINDPYVQKQVLDALNGKADAVLSDASPKLTGIRERDHIRSLEIIKSVLDFTQGALKKGGNLLIKLIEGPDIRGILGKIQNEFSFTKIYRPDSTRKSSRENYIIAKGFII
jgi:23S rRNA (uridine2552-2'-O)-methyltransferase